MPLSKPIGALILALALLAAVAHAASAKSRNVVWLDVPVKFAGDRKHADYKNQSIGSQPIWYGEVHMAKKLTDPREETLTELEGCGCKVISKEIAAQAKYHNIRKQLAQSSCVAQCKFAGGDEPGAFECGPLADWLGKINADNKTDNLIVFAHGCCITQKEAFDAAADLMLSARRPLLLYDWSTVSFLQSLPLPEFNSYRRAERAVETSEINFERLLAQLAKTTPPTKIVLVGHSMGNRLLLNTLRAWDATGRGKFGQIHLVKPDLSMQAFLLQESKLCKNAEGTYVYCSARDQAIVTSTLLSSGVPRLGAPGVMQELLDSGRASAQKHDASWFIDLSRESGGSFGHAIPYSLLGSILNLGLEKTASDFDLVPSGPDSRRLIAREKTDK